MYSFPYRCARGLDIPDAAAAQDQRCNELDGRTDADNEIWHRQVGRCELIDVAMGAYPSACPRVKRDAMQLCTSAALFEPCLIQTSSLTTLAVV